MILIFAIITRPYLYVWEGEVNLCVCMLSSCCVYMLNLSRFHDALMKSHAGTQNNATAEFNESVQRRRDGRILFQRCINSFGKAVDSWRTWGFTEGDEEDGKGNLNCQCLNGAQKGGKLRGGCRALEVFRACPSKLDAGGIIDPIWPQSRRGKDGKHPEGDVKGSKLSCCFNDLKTEWMNESHL